MDWMEILRMAGAPVIGAVIGYFTNYIAVKMLFFPRHEVRVMGHRLPFTPGAIPKGKERLAKAAGHVVADALVTREDMEQLLLSEKAEQEVAALVLRHTEETLHSLLCGAADINEETYQEKRAQLCDSLSGMIVESVDAKALVQETGGEYLREKAQSTMLKLVLTEKKQQEILEMIGDKLQAMIDEKGPDYVRGVLSEKFGEIEEQTAADLLAQVGLPEEPLREAVCGAYRRLVRDNMDSLLSHIHIADIVTEKINAMSVEEMEKLVLSMMKKELSMIVNLGALIGFVLGLFNLLLQ